MVAAAHALIRGLAAVAAIAGFDLNSVQGTVIGISAMVLAALYAAADIMVRILLRHGITPPEVLPHGDHSMPGFLFDILC